MNELTDLPNIGEVLAEKLKQTGISTPRQLKDTGSEEAYIKLAVLDGEKPCLNMLFAIEGAILNIRWHDLSAKRKQELKEFFKRANR